MDLPEKKESYNEESYRHCLAKSPPNLFLLECLQCKNRFSVIVHASPGEVGVSLALFPHVGGGIATPNTPPSVSYFLDQAYKAQSGGATTAAVVMYRAALEQILKNQGFKGDTVGRLLADLRRKIDINQAPKWAVDLNPAFMQVINDLGNEVHLNSEDQNSLNVYNEKLLASVQITFHELLDDIYERPEKLKDRLAELKAAQLGASTPSIVSSPI